MTDQLNKDFICKCGHKKEEHVDITEDSFSIADICVVCWDIPSATNIWGNCDKFTPDNLKYLESLNKEYDK